MSIKKDFIWRIYLAFLMVCLLGGAVAFQVFKIQHVEGDKWRSLADSLTTAYLSIEAERGNVMSEDGRLLATSLPFFEVRADLNAEALTDEIFYENVDSLAGRMAAFLQDKTKTEYKKKLIAARKSGNRYMLVMRTATYPDLQEIKSWPLFRLGRYKGGLITIQKDKRVNPFKMLAHRTIGYVREDVLPVGLEGSFDNYLTGVKGKRLMQKIAGGTWIPINDENEISSENGKDVVTTIDINLQDVVENALLKALKRHRADHGCAIVMEVKTGKIKAIANIGRYGDDLYWEKYNYAVGEATEPGSTFKLASMIALLEDGYVKLTDSVDLEKGKKQYYDRTMPDSEKHDFRNVTVQHAFEISSNVGISKLVNEYYAHQPEKFIEELRDLRCDQQVGIEIKGEADPIIKDPKDKDWSGVTLPWMAVGHELTQTPLQTLTLYNAVANNGRMMKPYLVKEIQQYGRTVKEFEPQVLKSKICSDGTLEKVKVLLEGVVKNGTADHLRNRNYSFAGKTGTAKMADNNRGYVASYQASFVGYFPAEEPMYSCIVVVNEPSNGVYYGGWVAGPVFREIADKIYAGATDMHKKSNTEESFSGESLPYVKAGYKVDTKTIYNTLGVSNSDAKNDAEWVACTRHDNSMSLQERKIIEGLVPNVQGMGLRDALFLLENQGLKVSFKGKGKVRTQSVIPGTRATKGREVYLELS